MSILEYLKTAYKHSLTLKKIPGLDFIRGLAGITVVLYHLSLNQNSGLQNTIYFFGYAGGSAVTFFFVLSGFLIGGMLFEEFNLTKTLYLGKFYWHRFLRILIPFAAYCLIIKILILASVINYRPNFDILISLFMLRSYFTIESSASMGHSWSLSVEEQFYILLPLMILFIDKDKLKKIILVLILAGPIIRILNYFFAGPAYSGQGIYLFHTRMDSLFLGVYAAYFKTFHKDIYKNIVSRINGKLVAIFMFISFIPSTVLFNLFKGKWLLPFGLTITSLTALLVIIYLSEMRPQHKLFNFFNNPVAAHFGTLSYGIYIWQQLFTLELKWGFLPVLVSTYSCTLLAYFIIEYPIVLYRKKAVS